MKRILIIKHGSLGDIIFSLSVLKSIKVHYFDYEIDLLTEKKYFDFFKKTNYFHNFIEDNRSNNYLINFKLIYLIINNKYDYILDLQNSSRTSFYNFFVRVFGKSIISSSRSFSHFKYIIPKQGMETTTQGLFNQLKLLDIHEVKNLEYKWLDVKLEKKFNNNFVLFITGASKNGKYKQWDPQKFGELAVYCEQKKYKICIIGKSQDHESVSYIINNCKNVLNKIDSSPPEVIYSLAKKSNLVITNDTGPGHIAALSKTNILWIVNDNKISKANISNKSSNFKIYNKNIKNISTNNVINYIKENNLL